MPKNLSFRNHATFVWLTMLERFGEKTKLFGYPKMNYENP